MFSEHNSLLCYYWVGVLLLELLLFLLLFLRYVLPGRTFCASCIDAEEEIWWHSVEWEKHNTALSNLCLAQEYKYHPEMSQCKKCTPGFHISDQCLCVGVLVENTQNIFHFCHQYFTQPWLSCDFWEGSKGRTKVTLSSDEADSGVNTWPRTDGSEYLLCLCMRGANVSSTPQNFHLDVLLAF